MEQLESSLQNAYDNSDAIFVEVYEERLWEASEKGDVLNPSASGRTVAEWTELFHERRRKTWGDKLAGPFPLTHRHTFKRTFKSKKKKQVLHYVHGSKCAPGKYGVIVISQSG